MFEDRMESKDITDRLKAAFISKRKQFLVGRQQRQHRADQLVHKMADSGQRRAKTPYILLRASAVLLLIGRL
jgi:hypothetical protein